MGRLSQRTGIAVAMVVQNDEETIEPTILSFYDHVDRILVITDPRRGFSGKPIVPDQTVSIIRSLDHADKVEIMEGDFYQFEESMKNETHQRQFAADRLAEQGKWKWIFQIDADEVFLDFAGAVKQVAKLKFAQAIFWRWITVFNHTDDGRLLVIVDPSGQPVLSRFPLAHRPDAKLYHARWQKRPDGAIYKIFSWRYEGGRTAGDACLHYSYAKSEARIKEKLATFGHSGDFDTQAFFELWRDSSRNWQTLQNFHPIEPELWPALRPFTKMELAHLVGCDEGLLVGSRDESSKTKGVDRSVSH